MNKLFQINECLNYSTGRIAQHIGDMVIDNGWESWIAYSSRQQEFPSRSNIFKIGHRYNAYYHYIQHKLFDKEGLISRRATYDLINQIDKVRPNIIHLHNIHDHYLNYPLLFEYFANSDIPIVWTQHDCWAFTGGCMYFDQLKCEKWKTECFECPERRALFADRSREQFALKASLLNKINKLIYIPVSYWLSDILHNSSQHHREIITIHNGIDTELFKPAHISQNVESFNILGVAAVWDSRKGLDDFILLRKFLPRDYHITLVGLSKSQIANLPDGIVGINRTNNINELVHLYSNSNVFVNPTYSDNFPTTNIEALSCGVPVITYETGGSVEAIDQDTGIVVPQGDIRKLADSIMFVRNNPFSALACRERAVKYFDRKNCYQKYMSVYNSLI